MAVKLKIKRGNFNNLPVLDEGEIVLVKDLNKFLVKLNSGYLFSERDAYESSSDPTSNHDSADTAGLGFKFQISDKWVNTTSKVEWTLVDATPTAAVWKLITGGSTTADVVTYDNGDSGLLSTNVQDAIDELVGFSAIAGYWEETISLDGNFEQTVTHGLDTPSIFVFAKVDGTPDYYVSPHFTYIDDNNTKVKFDKSYTGKLTIFNALKGGGASGIAAKVTYDNTFSGLTSISVQSAIDEIYGAGFPNGYYEETISLDGSFEQSVTHNLNTDAIFAYAIVDDGVNPDFYMLPHITYVSDNVTKLKFDKSYTGKICLFHAKRGLGIKGDKGDKGDQGDPGVDGTGIGTANDYYTNFEDRVHADSKVNGNQIVTGGSITQQSTPDMTVAIDSGEAIVNGVGCNWSGQSSSTFTAPTSNPRWDAIVINSNNNISIVSGTESATPVNPTIASTQRVLGLLYMYVGMTSITTSDISDWRYKGSYNKNTNTWSYTDDIQENVSGNGITIDDVLLKDGKVDNVNVIDIQEQPINTQTGTSYTLALSDLNKLITLDNGSAITLTVPTNSSVPFAIGNKIDLCQLGAGQVTVSPYDGNVTLRYTPSNKLRTQYSVASLVKLATNTWLLCGDLELPA